MFSMFHSGNFVLILTLPTWAPPTKLQYIHFLSCKILSEKGFQTGWLGPPGQPRMVDYAHHEFINAKIVFACFAHQSIHCTAHPILKVWLRLCFIDLHLLLELTMPTSQEHLHYFEWQSKKQKTTPPKWCKKEDCWSHWLLEAQHAEAENSFN